MRYYTKEWYMLMHEDCPEAKDNSFYYNPEKIKEPAHVVEAMDNDEPFLLSIRKHGNDLIMIIDKPYVQGGGLPYRKIVFRNYHIIERESGIRPVFEEFENSYDSIGPYLAFTEEYAVENGYEIHMLFELSHLADKHKSIKELLRYLTLTCSDVEYEDGIDPNKYLKRRIDITYD